MSEAHLTVCLVTVEEGPLAVAAIQLCLLAQQKRFTFSLPTVQTLCRSGRTEAIWCEAGREPRVHWVMRLCHPCTPF
jgi:hypothetical protein